MAAKHIWSSLSIFLLMAPVVSATVSQEPTGAANDYQSQVRQDFQRNFICVTTQQLSVEKFNQLSIQDLTKTIVPNLAQQIVPCILSNSSRIRINLTNLIDQVVFATKTSNDSVVIIVAIGRQKTSGSDSERPGLPQPVQTVEGIFQVFQSKLAGCQPGNYKIRGSFDSTFTTFTLMQAGGAEGCFSSVPAQLFSAPGLIDGGADFRFESAAGPGNTPIVGTISRVYGSFSGAVTYPNAPDTVGVISLNSQNTKVTNQGIASMAGNPNDIAIDKLPDLNPPSEAIQNTEITTENEGVDVVRTLLNVELADNATVEEVNAALAAVGGTIVSSTPLISGITIRIPDTGKLDGVENAEAILSAQPAVLFSSKKLIYPTPSLTLVGNPDIPNGDLIPIPLLLSGAVNEKGEPPIPLKPDNNVSLFLADRFASSNNEDLNLQVDKFNTSQKENSHGYLVAGLMAAKRDNELGIMGVYPASNQLVVGFNPEDNFDKKILKKIAATPGRFVVNFSLGSCAPPRSNCLKEEDAKKAGASWARNIRNYKLENRVVITASAGNGGSSTQARNNSGWSAAGLRDDFDEVRTIQLRQCRLKYYIFGPTVCESVSKWKENIKIPRLNNTLVAANLNANTGTYANSSTRGENVRAIGFVTQVDPSLTNGNSPCNNGFLALIPTEVITDPVNKNQKNQIVGCFEDGGTSSAAPQVAGLAAYLWNQNPNLTAPQVVQRIIESQTKFKVLDNSGKLTNNDSQLTAINVRETLGLNGLSLTGDPPLINTPPVANNDTVTVRYGQSATINVLANDTGSNGDKLTVTNVTQSKENRTKVVLNPDGTITYFSVNSEGLPPGTRIPAPECSPLGPCSYSDSFTYTISNRKGGTATGTVNVTINY
jgi:hypothetical protein